MRSKTSPIGIIDSGIGGFSVVRRMQRLLPGEDLLYLGDGANTPYGNHTAQEILTMTRHMLRFMEEKQVKGLLVACNTISCLIDSYRADMSCPVFSIVQAGAEAVREQKPDRVGVVSTCFTANSRCYPRLIGQLSPETQVVGHGCADLASIVERGLGDPQAQAAIDAELFKELSPLVEEGIRVCVLGCTHFPLVEENIRRLFPTVRLLDPAEQMVGTVRRYLEESGLANDSGRPGMLDIFTTGNVEEYADKAEKAGLERVASVRFYPPIGG